MAVKFIWVRDESLEEEVVNYFLSGPKALQAITNLRKVPPVRVNPDPSLTELITDKDLAEYFSAAPVISESSFSIQAAADSYRRFVVKDKNNKKFSLKMPSPINPPALFTPFYEEASDASYVKFLLEAPERRSMVIHHYLQNKGLPCATRPIGIVSILPEETLSLYNGELVADSFLPFDISVEELTKETVRIEYLTPALLERAAAAKGAAPKEYLDYLLQSAGKLHYQLHHIEGQICLSTARSANSAVKHHFFGFSSKRSYELSQGENPLHNTEIDLNTGEAYLTADFSRAFLLSSEAPTYLGEFLFGTTVHKVEKEVLEEERKTSLAYFVDLAQHNRQLLHCLHYAGNITSQHYQEHLGLLDDKLDAFWRCQQTSGHKARTEALKLNQEIIRLASPWCTFADEEFDESWLLPIPIDLNKEVILGIISQFVGEYNVRGTDILVTIKKNVRTAFELEKKLLEIAHFSDGREAYEQVRAKEQESADALTRSPVTQTIFDRFMQGYKAEGE